MPRDASRHRGRARASTTATTGRPTAFVAVGGLACRVGPVRRHPGSARRGRGSRLKPLEQILQVRLGLEGLRLAVGQLVIRFGHRHPPFLFVSPVGIRTGRCFCSVAVRRLVPARPTCHEGPPSVWRRREAACGRCAAGGARCGKIRGGPWHEPRNGAGYRGCGAVRAPKSLPPRRAGGRSAGARAASADHVGLGSIPPPGRGHHASRSPACASHGTIRHARADPACGRRIHRKNHRDPRTWCLAPVGRADDGLDRPPLPLLPSAAQPPHAGCTPRW